MKKSVFTEAVYVLLIILAFGFIFASESEAGKKSRENKAACLEWCGNNRDQGCEQCASYKACGKGYSSMRKFGKVASWHACRKNSFGRRGEQNEANCKTFCGENPVCVKCMTSSTCGPGLKFLKSFRGEGADWYACMKTNYAENTEQSRNAARQWCQDYERENPDEECRIVKTGKKCPNGFYTSERLNVTWGKNYKVCLEKKVYGQRVKDCSGKGTADVEKALAWLDENYNDIVRDFRLQPNETRDRRAHERFDRKFPKTKVTCEDHRKKCKRSGAPAGWSTGGLTVHLCYENISTFCGLVEVIMHEAGHNAWSDVERPHNTNPDVANDTTYQLGFLASRLCRSQRVNGQPIDYGL